MYKAIDRIVLALLFALGMVLFSCVTPYQALAKEGETHHLAFASDYHSTEGSIATAMEGMPEDVEYVSMIGDMVGSGRRDFAPQYESRMILELVQEVFPHLDNSNVSLIWASHDANVVDEGTNIVKCLGGSGSGPIYQGLNEDGSTAYHIYAIAFNEMKEGGDVSAAAAASFKEWVDGVDPTIPIIVLCHMPLQAKRSDNLGALYWCEALNYAATGVEGISSTDLEAGIRRNVIFLCAHNHTVSRDEYYFPAGGTMEVQVDTSVEDGSYSEAALLANGASVEESEVVDEEYEEARALEELGDQDANGDASLSEAADEGWPDPGSDQRPGPRPGPPPTAKGVESNIYFTSLVAGYLKTSASATLVTIDGTHVTFEKYSGGKTVALGVDGVLGETVESPQRIEQFRRTQEVEHASVDISNVDGSGQSLQGATFALMAGDKVVGTYAGGTFSISTDDEALSSFLPAAGESATWSLTETKAPEGYEANGKTYELVVSAQQSEELKGRTYVNTTTYSLAVDGGTALKVPNDKKAFQQSAPATTSGNAASTKAGQTKASQSSKAAQSSLPRTGDGSTVPEGPLSLMVFGAFVLGLGLMKRANEAS